MADPITLLACLAPVLTLTTIRQWSRMVVALLAMTGRVTMQGMARWTGPGGSYRTIQRFFATVIPWEHVFWVFFRTHLFDPDDVYLLGGDETVVTKAGKDTHGVDRFFSSLAGKPVPGMAFFTLSLISTKQRRSFPIQVEQVLRPVVKPANEPTAKRKPGRPKKEANPPAPSEPTAKRKPGRPKKEANPSAPSEPAAKRKSGRPKKEANPPAPSEPAAKRKPGRPKGSKTGAHATTPVSPEWQRIGTMIGSLLCRIGGVVPLTYVVLDGHFGNAPALQMVRQHHLHLVSKLRADSGLYLPYTGAYAGRGPHRKYGDTLILRKDRETQFCDLFHKERRSVYSS